MIKDAVPQYNKSSGSDLRKAFTEYLDIYTPDPQAKDTMISNIEKKLRKPITAEVQAHWNRIDLLFDYIDQLRGERTQTLTVNERKMYFYKTFPLKWRNGFATTQNLYKSSSKDIKNFMLLKKKTADAEENKNKNKNKRDNNTDPKRQR